MAYLSGKRLTAVAAVLMALSAAGAVRVAATGGLSGPAIPAGAERSAMAAGGHVVLAKDAEARGDLGAALRHYRAAVSLDPGCVDRRNPSWLGGEFEEKLTRWLAELKAGRARGGDEALRDASYLFRRMYGGCG